MRSCPGKVMPRFCGLSKTQSRWQKQPRSCGLTGFLYSTLSSPIDPPSSTPFCASLWPRNKGITLGRRECDVLYLCRTSHGAPLKCLVDGKYSLSLAQGGDAHTSNLSLIHSLAHTYTGLEFRISNSVCIIVFMKNVSAEFIRQEIQGF